MSLHANRHARAIAPPPVALLRPNPNPDAGGGDGRALAQTYRRFLRRTSDVSAAAHGYPGGFRSLIRDRELVTGLLVRLLQEARDPRVG